TLRANIITAVENRKESQAVIGSACVTAGAFGPHARPLLVRLLSLLADSNAGLFQAQSEAAQALWMIKANAKDVMPSMLHLLEHPPHDDYYVVHISFLRALAAMGKEARGATAALIRVADSMYPDAPSWKIRCVETLAGIDANPGVIRQQLR